MDKLARNPLGIIALFIVLVYGIAGVALGVSGNYLSEIQKTIFVFFLVLFPCLVLGCFLWLVVKHHTKLYAPSDYRNDEGFLGLLTPEQQRQKLDKEAEEVIDKSQEDSSGESTSIVLPPKNVIRSSIYQAEELAIREIESEFGVSVNRKVNLGSDSGIDGFFVKNSQAFGIEIKYTLIPISRNLIAKELRSIENSFVRLSWKRINIIFVIVFDDIDKQNIEDEKERLSIAADIFPFGVDLRFYGLSQLKEKYGLQ